MKLISSLHLQLNFIEIEHQPSCVHERSDHWFTIGQTGSQGQARVTGSCAFTTKTASTNSPFPSRFQRPNAECRQYSIYLRHPSLLLPVHSCAEVEPHTTAIVVLLQTVDQESSFWDGFMLQINNWKENRWNIVP